MSSQTSPKTKSGSVRFSRVMQRRWVVAMSLSVAVGLGVFTLIGPLVQAAGRQALAPPYLLMAVSAIPIILTFAERASVISGSGGPFNLARRSQYLWLTYSTGWLLLGGYPVVVALLGWGAALHFNLITQYLFNLSLNLSQLAVVIIGLAALNSILGTTNTWKTRSRQIIAAVVILLIFIIASRFNPSATGYPTTSFLRGTSDLLRLSALMMSGLWGVYFILNSRDEVHRPTRAVPQAIFITVAIAGGVGILAGAAIAFHNIIPKTLYPLLEITNASTWWLPWEVVLIVYGLSGLIITLIALNQGFIHGLRLADEMTHSGFLPASFQIVSPKFKAPVISLIPFSIFSILLVSFVPVITLAGLAALTFLWIAALVHLPDALSAKPNLPEKRFPKLPFHPLFPWLTIAVGIVSTIYLRYPEWILGIIWILLGGVLYIFYARQRGHDTHRQDVVVGEGDTLKPRAKADYVVMVGLSSPKTAKTLLNLGARLAQARHNSTLLALKVLVLAEQIPIQLKREFARKEWETLTEQIAAANIHGIAVEPLVRIAPTPAAGILDTITDEGVDLLVLGWERAHILGEGADDSTVPPLIRQAGCDVVVMRGSLPPSLTKVLVPTTGGPHAPLALSIGHNLAKAGQHHIRLENIVTDPLTPERESQAQAQIQATLDALKNGHSVETRIVEADTVEEGVLAEAKNSDLLLIGASNQGFLEIPVFGGLATEIATATGKPAILARSKAEGKKFWAARLLERISDPLPTLSMSRQADVYQYMRDTAQPSIDFFVLIALSAVIASLGLLQNSAAVIIGAMLVAPLMSPILAMAMSMVQGNLRLLRVAVEATTKGIVLAIVVGITVVVLSPIQTATTEILGRTEPNLLDLMVALASGAAAGYALSRKEVAAALPGVAIAAALVPPLCVVGYGIGTSQLSMAGGALLLFITNLIAIVLAAAVTFLALGFHPPRTERRELMRGLQVTVASLVIISIILAFTTIVAVMQATRQAKVEAVFQSAMVARSAIISEMSITRRQNEFTINAVIVDVEQNTLTPAELTRIEQELEDAVGGAVSLQAVVIPGTISNLENAATIRRLENRFQDKMVEHGAAVMDMIVADEKDGFVITSTVIINYEEAISQQEMSQIQEELSRTAKAPVSIRSTMVSGTRLNIDPPTPTPEP